ncbi:TPA: hypothetical protein EYP13_02330 [Candidatus Micrarchaeota archaeon]|nr:hypothetical protein [Candidatus Micrarchaeota archaeon]
MVDANAPVVNASSAQHLPVGDIAGTVAAYVRDALLSTLKAVASVIKPVLDAFGITLSPAGYVVVAAFVVAALIYSLHKMAWNVLKALAAGVLAAILLSGFGIIK